MHLVQQTHKHNHIRWPPPKLLELVQGAPDKPGRDSRMGRWVGGSCAWQFGKLDDDAWHMHVKMHKDGVV